jgi:hypothetical protein
MNLVSSLDYALDEFTGICAVGALYNAGVETLTAGHTMSVKITGSLYWNKLEHPIAVWSGDQAEVPGTPDADTWLRLEDRTMRLSQPVQAGFFDIVPTAVLKGVVDAIAQMSAMLEAATDALDCAETEHDLTAILERLKTIASESKSLIEHESEALLAHTDIMFNCMVDLLGNMTVTESTDVHLAFDLGAETLDPATGDKVKIRVGWAKADEISHQFVHSFEVGSVSCRAHDDADMDRMLETFPETSREHYRHTFIHLHQAAHAVGDYAAGKVGEAIAKASTVSDPLFHVERHEITHRVHAEAVEELSPFVWQMSGEPGRGGHEH